MTKLSHIASKTVIIHPGSTLLRIGLAIDENPKVFLHCIAREYRKSSNENLSCFPSRAHSLQYCADNESDMSAFFDGSSHLTSLSIDNRLHEALNKAGSHSEPSLVTSRSNFIPFLRGFKAVGSGCYKLEWPIASGPFNEEFTPSNCVQDLEDMWTYAIEHYLNIPKENFHHYSVILLIEDVFVRREVRQIVDMLLRNLKFARLVVQQASVCATYGVGLPTACVVDFGFQKTSISCVDEGISIPDVRVTLPVGVSDCLRTLHAAMKHHSRDKPLILERLKEIGYQTFPDTKLLFNAMFDADTAVTKCLLAQQLEGNTPSDITIDIPPEHKQSLPVASVVGVHLTPYFPKSESLLPEYQTPSIEAPEPDDPFDEVYIAATAREKKRKLQVDVLSARGDDVGTFDPKISKVQVLLLLLSEAAIGCFMHFKLSLI
uniref:Actin-related protein 8 n=1 Tax=Mesocestoides corti TaxID=53468 RepID=A0A5K3FFC0_MESCO